MLLYAEFKDDLKINNDYMVSGNKISVKTLNLDSDFKLIKEQLDKIVYEYFWGYIKKFLILIFYIVITFV